METTQRTVRGVREASKYGFVRKLESNGTPIMHTLQEIYRAEHVGFWLETFFCEFIFFLALCLVLFIFFSHLLDYECHHWLATQSRHSTGNESEKKWWIVVETIYSAQPLWRTEHQNVVQFFLATSTQQAFDKYKLNP